ncbi:ABC transporter permease [Bacillus sonorensis]|uniref:ABC transporter permease n=1 Tax=Bacillus TaxID=1386 RepID=UPI0004969257|nr:ABC transporter permease [Bacillus sonorensis]MBG9915740.1 ABC transporter permease [Bacillus sonorensis]MCF7617164.1 ABC transporter permease [Bacillus sonorensis]MCY7859178.1 ABC transporter permease [Bacillus sonorensis]MCY8033932.1 ABC transporter permease [Bacillus sonorensis]MCY8089817.1 ABC transporter permease [Bacillus sonorensis]
MVDRGLIYKEWKQHQALLLAIFFLLFLSTPLSIISEYFSYQGCLNNDNWNPRDCQFYLNYQSGGSLQFFWAPGVFLAVAQLGLERSRGLLDFTLSLPYSRGQVFHTKFWMGGTVLVGAQLLGYLLSKLLIILLKPGSVEFFDHFMIGSMIISLMAYSLVMAAGALTGNLFAQLLTSFTVTILPFLIVVIPALNLRAIIGRELFWDQLPIIDSQIFQYMIPIIYVNPVWVTDSKYILLIPAAMGILFYVIGYISFVKHPSERSGSFFLWKQLDRPIHIFVIIASILSFGYFGYGASESMIGYVLGMILGAVIGFFISYFAIYKKMKH